MAARKGESGFMIVAIWARREGRSLIQWREREERTAEKECGAKGRGALSGSERIMRVWEGREELKGRWASRLRRIGDQSAEVRDVRRVCSGGSVGMGGGVVVRTRAILQALAPRSRTDGKCRFMS